MMSASRSTIRFYSIILIAGASLMGTIGCSTVLKDDDLSSHPYPPSPYNQFSHKAPIRAGNFSDAAIAQGYADLFRASHGPGRLTRTTPAPGALNERSEKPTDTIPASDRRLTTEEYLQQGWSLLLEGKYSMAEASYRMAIQQNAELPTAYLGLGIALRYQGNQEQARVSYEQALRLRPDYAAAMVHLGYLYADGPSPLRNMKKARQFFQKAVSQGDPLARIALIDLTHRP